MKVTLKILLVVGCCSALVFSKGVESSANKTVKISSSIKMSTIKYSQGYTEFNGSGEEGTIERKRSHKRRKAVRKPRRGRGQ